MLPNLREKPNVMAPIFVSITNFGAFLASALGYLQLIPPDPYLEQNQGQSSPHLPQEPALDEHVPEPALVEVLLEEGENDLFWPFTKGII